MSETPGDYSSYSLHVVLATFPQGQEENFHRSVKEDFYAEYRDEATQVFNAKKGEMLYTYGDDQVPIFYHPLSYFILGTYDIAYIALIDNFKFAQRLFEPRSAKTRVGRNVFGTHTFQTFTGIARESDSKLLGFFHEQLRKEKPVRKFFAGISNLKLNNEILIGNGSDFLEAVNKKIAGLIALYNEENETAQVQFLRVHSFSWFEVSLLLFADDPQDISAILQTLRRLTLGELDAGGADLAGNSIYSVFFPNMDKESFLRANIFADTHTYLGLHSDLIDDESYLDQLRQRDIRLRTLLEWRVKPGHLHLLNNLFRSDNSAKEIFGELDQHLLLGSSDYCLSTKFESPLKNVRMIRFIMKGTPGLFRHISKVKTKVFFDRFQSSDNEDTGMVDVQELMPVFAETITAVRKIDQQLKALKISRQIRSKILKLFSNYNNGIQDMIMFPYLMDFTIFVEQLKNAIKVAHQDFLVRFNKPENYTGVEKYHILEDVLMKMITIFQEGFSIRMLNNYQFEDINDFDLDFNSSIQQLLSTYSTLAFELGNVIYEPEYSYGPVVQLNMKDTISNNNSINYYINHLTSPEFVFATFSKEILNTVILEDIHLNGIMKEYDREKAELFKYNAVLRDMEDRKLINFRYFLNDAMRLAWTYQMDFDLFYYWFWTYNFQNASLYDELGILSELHFQKELFRILFNRRLFAAPGETQVPLVCPLPELEAYWDRHYELIEQAVAEFIRFLDEKGIAEKFLNYLQLRLHEMMRSAEKGCTITGADQLSAYNFTDRLAGRYKLDIMPQAYTNQVAKRYFAFSCLSAGEIEKSGVAKNSLLYLEWYMWDYLKKIYRLNNGKIDILRRNWQTGRPMISFMRNQQATNLYSVDQTGGLFFDTIGKQRDYLKMSTAVLTDLWHYALVRKKSFIQYKFNAKFNRHDRGE